MKKKILGTEIYIWLLFLIISLFSLQSYNFDFNGIGLFILFLSIELLILNFLKYFNTSLKGLVKKLFFSNAGYYLFQVAIIVIFWVIYSTITYEPSLFDFKYWGLESASYPLLSFLDFHFDRELFISRSGLYAIFIANILFIVYGIDFVVYIFKKIIKKFRRF